MKLESARKSLRVLADAKKKAIRHEAEMNGLLCKFCDKKNHSIEHCAAVQTECPNELNAAQREFAYQLLEVPDVRVEEEYGGLSVEQATAKLRHLTDKYNKGNPWSVKEEELQTRDRLRARAGMWKAIGAENTVLSWILFGANLPFAQRPLPLRFPNHLSYSQHEKFVTDEIEAALRERTFIPLSVEQARTVNPISVEPNKAGTKLRMCVDARWPNAHSPRMEFTLESIQTHISQIVKQSDELITTNISRAYYSVPITKESTPYLAVEYKGGLAADCLTVWIVTCAIRLQ